MKKCRFVFAFAFLFVFVFFFATLRPVSADPAIRVQRSVAPTIGAQPPALAPYEVLMRASPQNRAHYLKQVHLLLVDLSKNPNSGLIADERFSIYREYILKFILTEAKATGDFVDTAVVPKKCPTKDDKGDDTPKEFGNRYVCPDHMLTRNEIGHWVIGESQPKKEVLSKRWQEAQRTAGAANNQDAMREPRDQCREPEDHYEKEDLYCANAPTTTRSNECIIAGMISKYEGPKCKPIEFTCANGATPDTSNDPCKGSTKVSCGSSDKFTLCNPIIFGMKDPKNPFCVLTDNKLNPTRACARLALNKNSGGTPDFLAEGNVVAKAAAWKRFSESFSSLCKTLNTNDKGGDDALKTSPNCKDCLVMKRRITAMNTRLQYALNKKGESKPRLWLDCKWDPGFIIYPSEQNLKTGEEEYRKSVQ